MESTTAYLILLNFMFQGALLSSPPRGIGNEIGSVGDIITKVNQNISRLVQGDIAVEVGGKKFINEPAKYWPNAIMYYTFAPGLAQNVITNIQAAMQEYTRRTCVSFVQRTNQNNFVQFQSSEPGCFSYLGMTNRLPQELNIGTGCNFVDVILHEIGHAFGLIHEHNRPDRETFITINQFNVRPDRIAQFEITSNANTLGVPYDFLSIMHYNQHAFTANGQPTITARPAYANFQNIMGTGRVLSANDILAINRIYCPLTSTIPPVTQPPVTQPPVTQPPVTQPPVTQPPVTQPPVTQPPVTQPPVTQPPVTQPPVTQPPVTQPPVTQPPVTQPPVTQPPVTSPPGPPADMTINCVNGHWQKETVSVGQTITVESSNYPENNHGSIDCNIEFDPASYDMKLHIQVVDTSIERWTCREPFEIATLTHQDIYRSYEYCRNQSQDTARNMIVHGYVDFNIESPRRNWRSANPRKLLVTVTGVL